MTMLTIALIVIFVNVQVNALVLKQVVILSRHSIRAPLVTNLNEYTKNEWPPWTTHVAHLTTKGTLLEGYMGEYFSTWMQRNKLFEEECPQSVLIYANSPQRTIATAEAFTKSAFQNCNVKINVAEHKVFYPILRNDTDVFKKAVVSEMRRKLDNLDLHDAYKFINNIVNVKNSTLCETKSICDMTTMKDVVLFKVGDEPNVYGPLSIGNSIVDVFLMSLYQGHKTEDIAWGKIRSQADWRLLTKITKENQNIRFKSPTYSRHLAEPLLDYMKQLFLEAEQPTFAAMFGHDSTLNAVMSSLDFKPYELPKQYELTPIGGKIVFQKWQDEITGTYYLKVEYIYQSVGQLRFSTRFGTEESPETVVMEINNCAIDKNGLCSWDNFVDILQSLD